MSRPFGFGRCRRSRGGAAFSPASLFAGGALGGIYDPTDIATLFQDSAGATPVTAATQPVGRINDKSGNGNHLVQATAGARPTYQTTSGFGQLLLDGTDDNLIFPINLLSGWTSGTGLFAAKIAVDPPLSNNGAVLGFFANGGSGELYPSTTGHVGSSFLSNAGKDCGDPGDLSEWHSADFRSAASSFIAGFNTVDYFTTGTNTVAVTTGAAGVPALGNNAFGQFFAGRVGRVIVINRVLNAADLAAARKWIAAGYGG